MTKTTEFVGKVTSYEVSCERCGMLTEDCECSSGFPDAANPGDHYGPRPLDEGIATETCDRCLERVEDCICRTCSCGGQFHIIHEEDKDIDIPDIKVRIQFRRCQECHNFEISAAASPVREEPFRETPNPDNWLEGDFPF